jgi:hypothetical protein
MHRYEQVDQPSNKAVTLTFGTNGGRDRGEVTGPTKIFLANWWSYAPLNQDRSHRQLYRSTGPRAGGAIVIAPGIWRNVTVGRANSM